jgi:hypothetical protein
MHATKVTRLKDGWRTCIQEAHTHKLLDNSLASTAHHTSPHQLTPGRALSPLTSGRRPISEVCRRRYAASRCSGGRILRWLPDLSLTTTNKGSRTSHLVRRSELRRLSRPAVVVREGGGLADGILLSLLSAGRGGEGPGR